MEQPNGHPCPECGTPRLPDNTPACTCTHRAAEALRNARTTQAAAAEDFDPLRIRPYVELTPDTPTRSPEDESTPGHPSAEGRPTPPSHMDAPTRSGDGAPRRPHPSTPSHATT
ncbi:peptidoglycan-binding domain-containing protein, partial [Streptomyces sp. URMC 128]